MSGMQHDFVAKGDLLLPKHVAGKFDKVKGFGMWAKTEIELLGADGKILDKRVFPSHSFMRNFGRFVRGFLSVQTNVNEDLIDSGGVARKPRLVAGLSNGNNEGVVAAAASMKFGNGNAAVDSTQFELQGTILGPTTAVTTTTILSEDATQTQWKIEGQVTNGTGGSFTVKEIALYAQMRQNDLAAQNRQMMMLRDLTGDVVVGNTLTILGRYTFTVAV